jgi:hypothetical protein
MSKFLNIIREKARLNASQILSYERVWSVCVGANNWRKESVNLGNSGYYLFYEDEEPYQTPTDSNNAPSQVTIKTFVFIGPFSNQKAAEARAQVSGIVENRVISTKD